MPRECECEGEKKEVGTLGEVVAVVVVVLVVDFRTECERESQLKANKEAQWVGPLNQTKQVLGR